MEIVKNKSLKKYNTFNIEVSARLFCEVLTEDEITGLLKEFEFSNEKIMILGGGSNVLFTKDFDGLVVKNSIAGIKIIYEDDNSALVKAGAGVVWNDLVLFCIEKNLGGIENLILIPGTVGAAPIQNIGAYGAELKDVFHSLKAIDKKTGKEILFTKDECKFGYRDSIFKHELKGEVIITYIILELSKNPLIKGSYGKVNEKLELLGKEKPGIADIANVIANIRREKLPDPDILGNAGSFFKNPIISSSHYEMLKKKYPGLLSYPSDEGKCKVPAGFLIEHSGWKGKRIGNAGSHEKQSLVLVNYGGASGVDILKIASEIKASVKKFFDIELAEEVNIV